MMKKIVGMVLALVLCLGMTTSAFASTGYSSQWENFALTERGDQNGYVKAVQRIVRDHCEATRDIIGDNSGVDGSFGAKTHEAVILFQEIEGCSKKNGIVGSETWGKLDEQLSYDKTEVFNDDGTFQMYKGTACFFVNYVIRRGSVSGNWGVRTSSGGTSVATNGTYQTFDYR